jgi:cellulose biosynthesis protein BcsQ
MSTFLANLDSATPSPTALRQIVLWIGANAGGVGKTTLAVHIGYEMANRGFDVAILDLDSNGSMSLFCGLPIRLKISKYICSRLELARH